jgi:Domain of unknown function (DUF4878)
MNKKNRYLIIVILCTTTFFVSCTKKKDATNSPSFVLELIKTNAQNGDLKLVAENFCDKDKRKLNTISTVGELLLGGIAKAILGLIKTHLLQNHQLDFDNMEFKNETINNSEATIEAYNKSKVKVKTFHFTKENDTWKMCKP